MFDDLSFAPEDDGLETDAERPWNILIVDDDMDVHTMTTLTLKDVKVYGRQLNLLHCYSGQQAIERLMESMDVDLILLDMVMETHDAGLRVARWLREDLGRVDTPIVILRTGHPGMLTTEDVMKNRHFNAFMEKSNVTYQSLINTLTSLLPSPA